MPHRIESSTLSLSLDDRGRVVSLVHRASQYEFLSALSQPVGLWQLGLIRPVQWRDPLPAIRIPDLKYEGHEWWANRHEYRADLQLDADQPSVAAPAIAGDRSALSLTWVVPFNGDAGGEKASIVIHVVGGADRPTIEFRCDVRLPSTWAVKRATFPRVRGLGDRAMPQDDALLYPENWGVLRRNPLDDMTNYTGQYPGAANWGQFCGWFHGRHGLYVGVLDPDTHHTGIDAQYVEGDKPAPWECERWHLPPLTAPGADNQPRKNETRSVAQRFAEGLKPSMQLRVNHWPAMASAWQCPYPVVLRGFEGDWFDAGSIHRQWATRQRWCRRGKLAERKDASGALAKLDLWFSRYGFSPASLEPKPAWDHQKVMHRILDFFGGPIGLHWYHWHNFSWHRQFPTHTPVVEGFEAVLKDLQARGVVVMPYCQGRLLYRDRVTIDADRAHATVEANGQPYLEKYTPEDDWPLALCTSDTWAQGQWREAARMLWKDYGTEGVYFDQITAMPPSLCYHAGHGHELGGGRHYWRGYDQALASMAPLQAENHDRFLSSELFADAFMDRIDLYLSFVPPLEDYVPLFSAVYGGYTTVMGRSTPGQLYEDLQLLAMAQGEQFVFGGQLGWLSEHILDFPDAANWLRDLVRLRTQVRSVLHTATMERPCPVTTEAAAIEVTLSPALTGKPRPITVRRTPVVHTHWRGADGRRLVLLVNESREAVTAEVTVGGSGRWVVRRQGSDEVIEQRGPTARVKLPGLRAAALLADGGS